MSIDGFLYSKSTTKLSKINNFPPVQDNTRPRQIVWPNRLVSSQEKNTSLMQEAVRFRGIHKIEASRDSSTRNLQTFLQHLTTNPHECAQMVVHWVSVCGTDFEMCVYWCLPRR